MRRGKTRRNLYIREEIDKALAFASVDLKRDMSDLMTEALILYLPTVCDLPQVQAIAKKEVAA